jgi:flagellar basal body-associated protein FliL
MLTTTQGTIKPKRSKLAKILDIVGSIVLIFVAVVGFRYFLKTRPKLSLLEQCEYYNNFPLPGGGNGELMWNLQCDTVTGFKRK